MEYSIETFKAAYPAWSVENGELVATFNFTSFDEVTVAVNSIMKAADSINHHPTVTFGYNTVEVKTVTHDAGNSITNNDFALARVISQELSK